MTYPPFFASPLLRQIDLVRVPENPQSSRQISHPEFGRWGKGPHPHTFGFTMKTAVHGQFFFTLVLGQEMSANAAVKEESPEHKSHPI